MMLTTKLQHFCNNRDVVTTKKALCNDAYYSDSACVFFLRVRLKNKKMAKPRGQPPVVTGISPKEGVPGQQIIIRGENLGVSHADLAGR